MEASMHDLPEILRLHRLWFERDPAGRRADLAGADLAGADLAEADLAGAALPGDRSGSTTLDPTLRNIYVTL